MPTLHRLVTVFPVLLVLAWACPSWGATFVVNCQNGPEPLIEAIETANLTPAHDRILVRGQCVMSSVYATGEDENSFLLPSITTSITLRGVGPSPAELVGEAGGSILHVAESGCLRLSRAVLRGHSFDGATIRNDGSLFARDVSFLESTSAYDAGALLNRGTAELIETTFRGNSAGFTGGAIYNLQGSLFIARSTFEDNRSDDNGGAIASRADLEIQDTLFLHNVSEDGGAVYQVGGSLRVSHSVFSNNVAEVGGAVISSVPVDIADTQFLDNRAPLGAALFAGNRGIVRDSTFAGNFARSFFSEGTVLKGEGLLIDSCAITHNTAEAALIQGTSLTIFNSTIAYNEAAPSGTILDLTGGQMSFTTVWNNHPGLSTLSGDNTRLLGNIVGNDDGSVVCASGGIHSGGFNLTSDSSCGFDSEGDLMDTNPELGPLGDHGGPTSTLLPARSSPAVDAIPASQCVFWDETPISLDQRDVRRPQGGSCDIGAVELWKPRGR